jgi:hypothetical protein
MKNRFVEANGLASSGSGFSAAILLDEEQLEIKKKNNKRKTRRIGKFQAFDFLFGVAKTKQIYFKVKSAFQSVEVLLI